MIGSEMDLREAATNRIEGTQISLQIQAGRPYRGSEGFELFEHSRDKLGNGRMDMHGPQ
jgi:hypothetical protein